MRGGGVLEMAKEIAAKYADSEWSDEGKLVSAISEALARVTKPSRIEAAERAVVEASASWADRAREHLEARRADSPRPAWPESERMLEAVDRLRALREQAGAETCNDVSDCGLVPFDDAGADRDATKMAYPKCDQPRGHEGKHSGDLGRWEWGDS